MWYHSPIPSSRPKKSVSVTMNHAAQVASPPPHHHCAVCVCMVYVCVLGGVKVLRQSVLECLGSSPNSSTSHPAS